MRHTIVADEYGVLLKLCDVDHSQWVIMRTDLCEPVGRRVQVYQVKLYIVLLISETHS